MTNQQDNRLANELPALLDVLERIAVALERLVDIEQLRAATPSQEKQ